MCSEAKCPGACCDVCFSIVQIHVGYTVHYGTSVDPLAFSDCASILALPAQASINVKRVRSSMQKEAGMG